MHTHLHIYIQTDGHNCLNFNAGLMKVNVQVMTTPPSRCANLHELYTLRGGFSVPSKVNTILDGFH